MVKLITDVGFCSGVNRAVTTIKRVHRLYPDAIIYTNHQVVHNKKTIDDLGLKDQLRIIDLSKVDRPVKGILVYSAHGHTLEEEDKKKYFTLTYDALCPVIGSEYNKFDHINYNDTSVIFYAYAEHREVRAIMSRYPQFHIIDPRKDLFDQLRDKKFNENIVLASQSTLLYVPYEKIKNFLWNYNKNYKFRIISPCPVLNKRVKNIKENIDNLLNFPTTLIVVVGDKNSSNAREMYRYAKQLHKLSRVCLCSKVADLPDKLHLVKDAGIISSTSANKEACVEIGAFLSKQIEKNLKIYDKLVKQKKYSK